MTITPLSDAIGAEVIGVDLSKSIADEIVAVLEIALLEHIVLVVRDQQLSPSQYVQALSAFGTPARQNSVD